MVVDHHTLASPGASTPANTHPCSSLHPRRRRLPAAPPPAHGRRPVRSHRRRVSVLAQLHALHVTCGAPRCLRPTWLSYHWLPLYDSCHASQVLTLQLAPVRLLRMCCPLPLLLLLLPCSYISCLWTGPTFPASHRVSAADPTARASRLPPWKACCLRRSLPHLPIAVNAPTSSHATHFALVASPRCGARQHAPRNTLESHVTCPPLLGPPPCGPALAYPSGVSPTSTWWAPGTPCAPWAPCTCLAAGWLGASSRQGRAASDRRAAARVRATILAFCVTAQVLWPHDPYLFLPHPTNSLHGILLCIVVSDPVLDMEYRTCMCGGLRPSGQL